MTVFFIKYLRYFYFFKFYIINTSQEAVVYFILQKRRYMGMYFREKREDENESEQDEERGNL